MRRLFADTSFYLALLLPRDRLHPNAITLARAIEQDQTITSDLILVEVLAHVSDYGPELRRRAAVLVDRLRADPGTVVVPQTRTLFDAGLDLYRRRLDKGYSLTDCTSMVICINRGVREVLTHDRHFGQEGFAILL